MMLLCFDLCRADILRHPSLHGALHLCGVPASWVGMLGECYMSRLHDYDHDKVLHVGTVEYNYGVGSTDGIVKETPATLQCCAGGAFHSGWIL